MSDSKFIRGTFIVTAGTFFIKFLGMIYIFPFYQLVGDTGNALYTYGYNQYAIFLSISTAGVPLAVAKFVSKYNAMGQYETSRRMFRSAFWLMLATGVVSFLTLYGLAPFIAERLLGGEDLKNTVGDVTYVIRMVSFALLIVPTMSLIRGFFQGHQSMGPTTVSQIIEQIVRIIFMLSGAYLVLKVLNGTVSQAVGMATFAAFIGALGGFLVLLWYWFKRKKHFDRMLAENPRVENPPSMKSLYKELFLYAIPFVFVGIAFNLYQFIDSFTFNATMIKMGLGADTEHQFGIFNMSAQKLVMIPVSLATAMGLTLVPAITKSFTNREFDTLRGQITKTFEIILFLTVPAVIGLSSVSKEAYTFLYSYDPTGAHILKWYAPAALAFALFSVTIAILQGLNVQRYAMYSLGIGVLCKLILNVPLIRLFEANGATTATAIGFFASVIFNCIIIRKYAQYSFKRLRRRVVQILTFTLAMGVAVWAVRNGLETWFDAADGKLDAFINLLISVAVGGLTYGYLSLGSGLAGHVLGARFNFLQKKRKGQSS